MDTIYQIPMPDGRVMLVTLQALQKIISEHKEMKELLQEFYDVRRAESSATGRRVRAEHRLEDFLKDTEAKS